LSISCEVQLALNPDPASLPGARRSNLNLPRANLNAASSHASRSFSPSVRDERDATSTGGRPDVGDRSDREKRALKGEPGTRAQRSSVQAASTVGISPAYPQGQGLGRRDRPEGEPERVALDRALRAIETSAVLRGVLSESLRAPNRRKLEDLVEKEHAVGAASEISPGRISARLRR